jgi:hypothetical protein
MRGATAAVLLLAAPATAGDKLTVARELAEGAVRKFGAKAAGGSAEALARRIDGFLARYGDDAAGAVARVGPRALDAADAAGPHAGAALRAMARHGDDGAAFVAARPPALRLAARHGDDGVDVLVRHRGAAEDLIEAAEEPAVRALAAVTPRAGRKVAMLHAGGDLAAIGRTPEVMAVVARYGDAAADFLWKNKGVLAGGAALAAFLADPEPYLAGARDLAAVAGGSVARPAVEGAFSALNTAVVTLGVLLAAGLALACRYGRREDLRHLIRRWGRPGTP